MKNSCANSAFEDEKIQLGKNPKLEGLKHPFGALFFLPPPTILLLDLLPAQLFHFLLIHFSRDSPAVVEVREADDLAVFAPAHLDAGALHRAVQRGRLVPPGHRVRGLLREVERREVRPGRGLRACEDENENVSMRTNV